MIQCPLCQHDNREGARFCDNCGAALTGGPDQDLLSSFRRFMPEGLAEKILANRGHLEGARKHVTVVFADVSGFTALSERLDPEEVVALMNRVFERLVRVVYHYEGTVDKFIGDCVMALFGVPVTHENDPERAVRGSLDMLAAVEELNKEEGLNLGLSIGINTGTVLVGEVGSDLRVDYTVMGDTVNLAQRLESAAVRGQILVSSLVHRLTDRRIAYRKLKAIRVKGKSGKIEIYAPTAVKPHVAFAEARRYRPLVGREQEMGELRALAASLAEGRGGLLCIEGEAGVGKSRLIHELRAVVGERVGWSEGACAAFEVPTLYQVASDVLRDALGLEEDATGEVLTSRLESAVTALGEDLRRHVPAVGLVFGLRNERLLLMGEQERQEAVSEGVAQVLLRAAKAKPQVLVFEDLHWVDAGSQSLLEGLAKRLEGSAVLLVCVYRPGFVATWPEREGHVVLKLEPLSEAEAEGLLHDALAEGALPPTVRTEILSRAQGNPFYLEEILQALVEDGSLRANREGRLEAVRPVVELRVPETIEGLLLSRLDRLEERAREALQRAAVIGHRFQQRLLKAVSSALPDLDSHLSDLEQLEYIYQHEVEPEIEYLFKHVLTQQVAYQSLLLERRKRLHLDVGVAIEQLYRDRLEDFYEALGYHYEQAEQWEQAARYYSRAGRKVREQHSEGAAETYRERETEALEKLYESRVRIRIIERVGAVVFCALVLTWLSYSGYFLYYLGSYGSWAGAGIGASVLLGIPMLLLLRRWRSRRLPDIVRVYEDRVVLHAQGGREAILEEIRFEDLREFATLPFIHSRLETLLWTLNPFRSQRLFQGSSLDLPGDDATRRHRFHRTASLLFRRQKKPSVLLTTSRGEEVEEAVLLALTKWAAATGRPIPLSAELRLRRAVETGTFVPEGADVSNALRLDERAGVLANIDDRTKLRLIPNQEVPLPPSFGRRSLSVRTLAGLYLDGMVPLTLWTGLLIASEIALLIYDARQAGTWKTHLLFMAIILPLVPAHAGGLALMWHSWYRKAVSYAAIRHGRALEVRAWRRLHPRLAAGGAGLGFLDALDAMNNCKRLLKVCLAFAVLCGALAAVIPAPSYERSVEWTVLVIVSSWATLAIPFVFCMLYEARTLVAVMRGALTRRGVRLSKTVPGVSSSRPRMVWTGEALGPLACSSLVLFFALLSAPRLTVKLRLSAVRMVMSALFSADAFGRSELPLSKYTAGMRSITTFQKLWLAAVHDSSSVVRDAATHGAGWAARNANLRRGMAVYASGKYDVDFVRTVADAFHSALRSNEARTRRRALVVAGRYCFLWEAAAQGFWQRPDWKAAQAVIALLADQDETVRRSAGTLISELESRASGGDQLEPLVAPLNSLLSSKARETRAAAASCLAAIGSRLTRRDVLLPATKDLLAMIGREEADAANVLLWIPHDKAQAAAEAHFLGSIRARDVNYKRSCLGLACLYATSQSAKFRDPRASWSYFLKAYDLSYRPYGTLRDRDCELDKMLSQVYVAAGLSASAAWTLRKLGRIGVGAASWPWTSCSAGIANPGRFHLYARDLVSDAKGTVVACTMGEPGVFRTSDQGLSWEALAMADRGHVPVPKAPGLFLLLEVNPDLRTAAAAVAGDRRFWGRVGPDRIAATADRRALLARNAAFEGGTTEPLLFRKDSPESPWHNVRLEGSLFRGRAFCQLAVGQNDRVFLVVGLKVEYSDEFAFADLFSTDDAGDTWQPLHLPCRTIRTLIADGHLRPWVGTLDGTYRSLDNGETWQKVNGPWGERILRAVVSDDKGQLFVGSFAGVFMSRDDGKTWRDLNAGLPDRDVTCLALDGKGNLFAGTWGSGVFRLRLKDVRLNSGGVRYPRAGLAPLQ